MKWINKEGVKFLRGCYEGLMARYDDTDIWFCMRGLATQQTQKAAFKRLGEYFNANVCEVKNLWDEDGNAVEDNVVVFMRLYSGEYKFYIETEHDLKPIQIAETA